MREILTGFTLDPILEGALRQDIQMPQGKIRRKKNQRFAMMATSALACWAFAGSVPVQAQGLKFEFPSLFKRNNETLEEIHRAPCGPGGMAITPKGDYIISCHQFFNPTYAVQRLNKNGVWEPFPTVEMNTPGSGSPVVLDSVLGIKCDAEGVVWMLDNARLTQREPPKLVAWDTHKNQLHKVLYLTPPAILKTSFLYDFSLDPDERHIYISDPANGDDAAIIVVDLLTGLIRRVLQGGESVKPEPNLILQLNGKSVESQSPDGSIVRPLAGAGPITVDRKGTWLYFGPMMGTTLYRVRTEYLKDANLHPTTLKSQVEGFSEKRIGGSITIDAKGNVYFADVQFGAIGYVTPDEQPRRYRHLVQDGRIIWPGGLTFGTDGRIHFFSTQLHLTPIYNSGKDATVPPYQIFRVKPLPTRFWE